MAPRIPRLTATEKVIFLDVDGVLHATFDFEEKQFHDDCIQRLKKIVDATGAKIVLSSSWRLFPDMRETVEKHLEKYGLKLLDQTPYIQCFKAEEIDSWIHANMDAQTRFVVLDDEDFVRAFPGNFVLTSANRATCLNDEHVQKAIEILNK